jgi:hypothetical protein
MVRPRNSARSRTDDETVDRLEEKLRQIGADILEEPVPEALRRVLARARAETEAEDGQPAGEDEQNLPQR